MKTWWKVGKRRQRNRNPMKTHWNNVKLRQMPPLHYPGSMGTCVILQNAPQQRGRSIDERRWSMRRTTCPHHLRSPSLTHSIRQTIRSMSTDTAAPPAKLIIWAFHTTRSPPRFVYAGPQLVKESIKNLGAVTWRRNNGRWCEVESQGSAAVGTGGTEQIAGRGMFHHTDGSCEFHTRRVRGRCQITAFCSINSPGVRGCRVLISLQHAQLSCCEYLWRV